MVSVSLMDHVWELLGKTLQIDSDHPRAVPVYPDDPTKRMFTKKYMSLHLLPTG